MNLASKTAFYAWLRTAHAGEQIEYYRGFLARDLSGASRLTSDLRGEAKHVARIAWAAQGDGLVSLVQRRNGEFDYTYIAVRNRRGARAEDEPLKLTRRVAA